MRSFSSFRCGLADSYNQVLGAGKMYPYCIKKRRLFEADCQQSGIYSRQ